MFRDGFEKVAIFEEQKSRYDKIMGKKGAHKHFDPKNEQHIRALLKAQGIKYSGHKRYWDDKELGLVDMFKVGFEKTSGFHVPKPPRNAKSLLGKKSGKLTNDLYAKAYAHAQKTYPRRLGGDSHPNTGKRIYKAIHIYENWRKRLKI